MTIQITEKTDNSAIATDGENTVEIVFTDFAGQIWIALNGAQFPKIVRSVQEGIDAYKRNSVKELIKTAADAIA